MQRNKKILIVCAIVAIAVLIGSLWLSVTPEQPTRLGLPLAYQITVLPNSENVTQNYIHVYLQADMLLNLTYYNCTVTFGYSIEIPINETQSQTYGNYQATVYLGTITAYNASWIGFYYALHPLPFLGCYWSVTGVEGFGYASPLK
jgi:hypothetical protein